MHQGAELRAHRQIRHRRGYVWTECGLGQRNVGDLVVQFDHLGLTGHPAVVRGADQTRIRRPSPRGVDAAVKVPRVQIRTCPVRRQRMHRPRDGLLDDQTARRLPLTEAGHRVVVGDLLRRAPIRHLGLTRPAPTQQPGQPAVRFVVRRCPPRDDLRLRPRHRHVHQAAVVAGILSTAQHRDGVEVRAVAAADVQAPLIPVMEQHQLSALHIAVERERQIHHRELQTLGHPHRHDLHRGRVVIQPPRAFGCAAPLLTLLTQPVPQSGKAEVLAVGRLLQQLGHVRQVGHLPLTALPRQHPVAHPAPLRGLEDRGDAALAGMARPLPQRLGDLVRKLVTARCEILGRLAEEHCRRGRAHHARTVRLVERLQQAQPVRGGVGVEDVGVAGVHRRDARLAQRPVTRAGILVALHDHRDITCLQRPAVERGAVGQQASDVGGEVTRDVRAQVVDSDGSSSAAAHLVPMHHPQPERLVARSALQTRAAVVRRDVVDDDPLVS